MNKHERINSILFGRFNTAITEDQELLELLPSKAHMVFQIEGYEAFNAWAREIPLERVEKDREVVYVVFKFDALPATAAQISPQKIASAPIKKLSVESEAVALR